MLFNVYYQSQENGEYLRQMVDDSGVGQLQNCRNLAGLPLDSDADVVLLEYQDDNPTLDRWISQTTGRSRHPEIFLWVKELTPQIIWKALKLGAREFFSSAVQPQDLQDAIRRAWLRRIAQSGAVKTYH
jgi:DNA-binding NarL/FixJ family response regulator